MDVFDPSAAAAMRVADTKEGRSVRANQNGALNAEAGGSHHAVLLSLDTLGLSVTRTHTRTHMLLGTDSFHA